jgi:hypothetical protein
MSMNEKRSPSFIIGSRHAGRSFLVSIKGYSSILHKNILGEMSDVHRQALKVIFDCCDIPAECWETLSELIEQNEEEQVMAILNQVDNTGQNYLGRSFICKSIESMEIAKNEASTILQQAAQLTDEQRIHVEIVHKHCQDEIEVWKEIGEYFS